MRSIIRKLEPAGLTISLDDGGKVYLLGLDNLRIKEKLNEVIDELNKLTLKKKKLGKCEKCIKPKGLRCAECGRLFKDKKKEGK